MSKILLIGFCIALFYFMFYKIGRYLKKKNKLESTNTLEKVVNKVGAKIVDNFVPNERAKKIIKKFPELFQDKKYFNNFDDLLNIISGFLSNEDKVEDGFFGFKGRMVITDDEDHPLQLTEAMLETTKKIVEQAKTEKDKAEALFNWFEVNISYGDDKRGQVGYRSATGVFNSSEGVCGELAILFMVMARVAGLEASYVLVKTDLYGENVNHACVTVVCSGERILIDPAYHIFNILHKDYKILSDKDLVNRFKSYR